MTAIVYFLVDKDGQEVLPKLGDVEKAGGDAHWFADMASSGSIKALERPGFSDLYHIAKRGDVLIICSLDILGRDTIDVLETVQTLQAKGVAVFPMPEGFDLATQIGKK